MSHTPSLTDPSGWRRLGYWFSFGLWNPDKGDQHSRPLQTESSAGTTVQDTRAMQIAAVFSAIRLLAELAASLPLVVYKRRDDGTREEAKDFWLSALLKEPNPNMTAQEFREAVVGSIAAWGNAYCEINRNGSGKPGELWPLRPEAMKVTRDGFKELRYSYEASGMPKRENMTNNQILHVKGFGTDGTIGLSPLGMAREALGLTIAAEQYAGSFYANGGKPSGVLMVDRVLNPQQRANIKETFQGMADGSRGGNRLWVLEAAMKYQAITIPPEDAQMLGTRQFQVAEIARFFRIPPHLLMDMTNSTSWGTGLEQQNLAFLAYTLRPYLTRIEQSFGRWLLTDAERKVYYVEHNVEGLLRADSQARAQFYSTMVQNGLMTRNEVRSKENLPRDDGADELTAQTNLAPLDKLGAQQEQPPPPAANDTQPMKEMAISMGETMAAAVKSISADFSSSVVKITARPPPQPIIVESKQEPSNVTVHVDGHNGKPVIRKMSRNDSGEYTIREVADDGANQHKDG